MSNLPQPPEGILDPQIPWSRINPNSRLWVTLKARLTGRPTDGEHYSSYVNISEADADRLIANLKKDPRGYPSLDQAGGNPVQWMENQRLYQEWLVEAYLENPFREETNKKIEDAAIESRLNEIQEQKKNKQAPPPEQKEDQQEELDQSQEALEEKIDDLTEDIDSLDEPSQQQSSDSPEQKQETEKQEEQVDSNKDLEKIKGSLDEIKGSLKIQAADLEVINNNNSSSIASLESLKQLFQSHTDILRRQAEQAKLQAEEQATEATNDVSGNQEGTDLTADNKAEGVIQGVDGEVLTIKTTEGQFQQGQTITQGGGGGGLFDMLKGIAGKFLGGKGGAGSGGGGSPLKLSSGGYSTSPSKLADGGTLAPGIYDRPTRGNLGLNQMAIPLNRNVGKPFKKRDDNKRLRKFDQPLVDVMSQPLKAIGLSILAIAGNFIRALGPLGGFFLPYAKGLVKGFAVVLGVPVGLIMTLLGGPAYAASEQQDRQVNIFAKIWDGLINRFGFDIFGGGDDKKKKKKKDGSTPSTATGQWGPLLDVIASGEGNYDSVNPGLKRPEILDKTISELVAWQYQSKAKDGGTAASGRYQMLHPESYAQNAGLSMDEKFTPENQDKMAAAYIEKKRGGKDWLAGKITDEDFGKELAKEWAALEYPGKGGGFYDGDGRNKAKVSFEKVKGALEKVKAEEGVQIKVKEDAPMGKFMGWQILDGPPSGYKVSDNLTMHGKEAYLQHENGFSILPIENNEYSLSKNPGDTLNRWKEILGPSAKVTDTKSEFADGGSKVFDPKKYQEGTESSKYITVGQGDKAKSYSLMYTREGASGTYIIKAISKKVSGNLFSGDNLTSVKLDSAEGQSVLKSTNVLNYFKSRTARSLQLKLKADPDASIFYGYNQAFQTTKNAWIQKGLSQQDAEKYAAAAAREFAVTRKTGSFLPGSKNGLDPSLKDVEVASGDTSSSNSSSESSGEEDPFTALQKAISGIMVGAGIYALQPKSKTEYDSLKTELESTFNITTPTAVPSSNPKNEPAAQQTTTPQVSPVPAPAPAPPASSGSVAVVGSTRTFHQELDNMTALYFA